MSAGAPLAVHLNVTILAEAEAAGDGYNKSAAIADNWSQFAILLRFVIQLFVVGKKPCAAIIVESLKQA